MPFARMNKLATLFLLIGLATARPAIAESEEESKEENEEDQPSQKSANIALKLPGTAAWLSVGGIIVPFTVGMVAVLFYDAPRAVKISGSLLILGSMTVFPSLGHVYTGDYMRAGLFSLARVGSLAVVIIGSYMVMEVLVGCGFSGDCANERPYSSGDFLIDIGLVSNVALSIWEAVDSYRSAKLWNRRARGADFALAPWIRPVSTGRSSTTEWGLGLVGRF